MSDKPVLLMLADTDTKIEKSVLKDQVELLVCPDLESEVSDEQWGRVQFIITNHLYTITQSLQQRCPQLKVIVRLGIGVDNIDTKAASELGICVCNVPDYGIEEVADTTFAHILAMFRQTTLLHQALQNGKVYHTFTEFVDDAHAARRIRGKTLGLIGMGNIGMAVCYRAKAFGFDVIVYDPYLRCGMSKAIGIEIVDTVEELIQRSHCVTIHCPLTPETKNIINEERLKLFKKDAFLVNTSRGGQIDEPALAKALKEGQIGGAALDVQCTEPFVLKGSPFEGVPNLVLTPHAGWYSKESYEDVRQGAVDVALYAMSHTDPNGVPNCVNKKTLKHDLCCARWSK